MNLSNNKRVRPENNHNTAEDLTCIDNVVNHGGVMIKTRLGKNNLPAKITRITSLDDSHLRESAISLFSYDGQCRITKHNCTRFLYYPNSFIRSLNQFITEYHYDAEGRLVKITNKVSHWDVMMITDYIDIEDITYDENGKVKERHRYRTEGDRSED